MTTEELIECLDSDGRYIKIDDNFYDQSDTFNLIKIIISGSLAYFYVINNKTGLSLQYAVNIAAIKDYDIFNSIIANLVFNLKETAHDINLIFK